MEKKEREVSSYMKTVEALTKELDELGGRVHELEQAKLEGKLLGLKEAQGKSKDDSEAIKEMRSELENVKEETSMYKELLDVQTEKVCLKKTYLEVGIIGRYYFGLISFGRN